MLWAIASCIARLCWVSRNVQRAMIARNAAMAQPRAAKGWRRAPTSELTRRKIAGSTSAARSSAKISGSKMKTIEAAYQCGLKGKNGRMP